MRRIGFTIDEINEQVNQGHIGEDAMFYFDPIGTVWENRPALPVAPVFIHAPAYAGKSVGEKLSLIRAGMTAKGVDFHLLTALDDIAWTFNLRGNDVDFNPVFYA